MYRSYSQPHTASRRSTSDSERTQFLTLSLTLPHTTLDTFRLDYKTIFYIICKTHWNCSALTLIAFFLSSHGWFSLIHSQSTELSTIHIIFLVCGGKCVIRFLFFRPCKRVDRATTPPKPWQQFSNHKSCFCPCSVKQMWISHNSALGKIVVLPLKLTAVMSCERSSSRVVGWVIS